MQRVWTLPLEAWTLARWRVHPLEYGYRTAVADSTTLGFDLGEPATETGVLLCVGTAVGPSGPVVDIDVVAAKVLAPLEAQVVTLPIALRDAADEARDSLGDVLSASDFHAALKLVLEIQERRRASRYGLVRRNHHDEFDAPDWVGVTLRPPSQGATRTPIVLTVIKVV
jgi:hypothetical protein